MRHLAIVSTFIALFAFSACSAHEEEHAQDLLMSGECELEIVSETHEAHVLIDGVNVGHGELKVHVPCGERKVEIEKVGFMPYEAFVPATHGAPLKITVKLDPLPSLENDALSNVVFTKIAKGEIGKALTKPKASSASAAASDAGASAMPAGDPNTVDYWR